MAFADGSGSAAVTFSYHLKHSSQWRGGGEVGRLKCDVIAILRKSTGLIITKVGELGM